MADQVVWAGVRDLMDGARSQYAVDPIVFLVIYLGSVPFFYYSIFRMVRALARHAARRDHYLSTVFLAATWRRFSTSCSSDRTPVVVYLLVALLIGRGLFTGPPPAAKSRRPWKRKRKHKERVAWGTGSPVRGNPPAWGRRPSSIRK